MAVKVYLKGTAEQLSKNFKSTEFDCHGSNCCDSTLIDSKLVDYLQNIRDHFNKPVNITSAHRCAQHNKTIGGATASYHIKGQAADIVINGVTPAEVAAYAEKIGVLGIGLYETDADGHFVHVDTRTSKYFWYGQSQKKKETFRDKIDTSKVDTSAADPAIIWDFFKKKGLNDYGIAGLMGNLFAESGLKPTNLQNSYERSLGMNDAEYTAAVDSGFYTNFVEDSAGYGLAQWTYWSLKRDMLEFHKAKNKSIGDLNTQLEFLAHQLTTEFKRTVWDVLTKATSVLEASNAVLLNFERPADQSTKVQNTRASYGQTYYDKYATKTTIPVKPDKPSIKVPEEGGNGKMKYSNSNKPLVCMQTNSTCYKGTSTMTIKGILWHSTGANNPWIQRYVQPSDNDPNRSALLDLIGKNKYGNDWNHISVQAGLNAWIGKLDDGTVATVQSMPWNYRPWGCGSGSKGSCNNGWIQFEICEDGLNDRAYFEKVYKEACELTAYLCKMFNVDPKATVSYNGVKVPTILCHADSCDLDLGSNHGDVLHWFPKFGKDMSDARNDVAKLMGSSTPAKPDPTPPTSEMYRVRKSWEDAKSQVGAYTSLENAKKACDSAGSGYEVYNSKGVAVYPNAPVDDDKEEKKDFQVGDEVRLVKGATYSSGKSIPTWVFESKLYVREIRGNGDIIISTLKSGAVTGVVKPEALVYYDGQSAPTEKFEPYLVKITASVLNVRAGVGTNYRINTQVRKNQVYTIIGEDNGWGKLKSGAGWVSLDYTKRI